MMRMGKFFGWGALFLLATGCGGDSGLGTVTGRVTMDGEPLSGVLVTFVPQGGGNASTGTTDANGQYRLTHAAGSGAELGTHTVRVTTVQAEAATSIGDLPSDSPEYQEMMSARGADYAQMSRSIEEKIPARYNVQSELVHQVEAGTNVIDLELTSD